MKKIFISHSSKDVSFVEHVIDLLEIMGIKSKSIFCTSFEGYGVALGESFLERIKKEINEDVIMIFILSNNYYESVFSICEMGAAWVKTDHHIPILIPPFNYEEMQGVIPSAHGMKINEPQKYNSLKKIIEDLFELEPIDSSVWERKRNSKIELIDQLLSKKPNSFEVKKSNPNKGNSNIDDNYYANRDEEIKERAVIEWPDDFNMQLHYIKGEKEAIQSLINSVPEGIDNDVFNKIREQGRIEWPNDFKMQLHYEKGQIESIRKLKSM